MLLILPLKNIFKNKNNKMTTYILVTYTFGLSYFFQREDLISITQLFLWFLSPISVPVCIGEQMANSYKP